MKPFSLEKRKTGLNNPGSRKRLLPGSERKDWRMFNQQSGIIKDF
jgi:hypothetical protein